VHPRLTIDIGWRRLLAALFDRGDAGRAEAAIRSRAPAGTEAVPALSVRTAFDALLGELALPEGAEVIASGVNIEGMAEIVKAHGLELIPLDLDLATLAPSPGALAAAVTPRARLFLLAHLYGARVETRGLAEACRQAGLFFVEDCAQAYLGRLELAEGADAALYSFGPIKFATALGGAAAVVRDPGLADRLRARLGAYPGLDDAWFRRRIWKYLGIKALGQPLPYGALSAAAKLFGVDADRLIGQAARGFKPGELTGQIRRRPPARLLTLLARRLAEPRDPAGRAALAAEALGAIEPGAVPGAGAARHGWWLAPVLTRRPAALVEALRRSGFDATRGSTSLRALAGPDGRATGEAQRLIEEVVYVPLAPHASAGARRRRDRALKAALGLETETRA
jgi:dTDP-4-amino-4,6-dideoxygalactose transaminase